MEAIACATGEDLRKARASGRCPVSGRGCYPFANQFFSHLTDYVRGGDFIVNLSNESNDLDE